MEPLSSSAPGTPGCPGELIPANLITKESCPGSAGLGGRGTGLAYSIGEDPVMGLCPTGGPG